MIILDIDNQYTIIKGADEKTIRRLSEITSYFVAGAFYAKSFKSGYWDGKEKLLKYSKGDGYRFPTGLLKDVENELKEMGVQFERKTIRKFFPHIKERVFYAWNQKIKLRPYQTKAVRKISMSGFFQGRGILKMPPRSGKTITAARIICDLVVKTLFIVPSKMLLYQTQKSLKESLLCEIGLIGDEKWFEENVTVATMQTLTNAKKSKDPRYKNLLKKYHMLIIDEIHHLTGETWREIVMDFNIPFKVGLSATVFLENKKQNERGAIWLKACCGNIRIDVSETELIMKGYLVQPKIFLYPIKKPKGIEKDRWSQTLHNKAIYDNDYRNKLIVKLIEKIVKKDLNVLIISNRILQTNILSELLDKRKINHHVITGSTKTLERENRVNDFVEKRVDVLVGTVFGEGVDIPQIVCVINAEGGADIKKSVQRFRNLTPSDNKTTAIFIDFMDLMNPYFAKHSHERLKVYRSEKAFCVKYINNND